MRLMQYHELEMKYNSALEEVAGLKEANMLLVRQEDQKKTAEAREKFVRFRDNEDYCA